MRLEAECEMFNLIWRVIIRRMFALDSDSAENEWWRLFFFYWGLETLKHSNYLRAREGGRT